MFINNVSSLILFLVFAVSCASKDCRTIKEEEKANNPSAQQATFPAEQDPMNKTTQIDKVRIFKADGSLQCGQGKAISLDEMKKQLGKIQVFTAFKKNDGLMRIQLCGHPTGNSNVYEIHKKDLEAAIKLGFKEWTNE